MIVMKYKLSHSYIEASYLFNSKKEAEQKAAELVWTEYIIQVVEINYIG